MTQMMFYILPGNPPPNFIHREQYNLAYLHYKNTWQRIFNRPGREPLYDPMGFFRQSYIFQISDGTNVVAQTLATHYHLKNIITPDLPFFENFIGIPLEYLSKNQCNSLLSLEFSSVGREYSERKSGVNFYRVIIQLAVNLAHMIDVDAVIGHPRRVTNTNQLIGEIGCKCIVPNLVKYGVSVDVYAGLIKELHPFDDIQANQYSNLLWQSRVDTTFVSQQNHQEDYFQMYHALGQDALRKGA